MDFHAVEACCLGIFRAAPVSLDNAENFRWLPGRAS
jgi:hypothetical protein